MAKTFREHPRAFALLLLTAGGFITYINSLPNSFHFDDIAGVVRNPTIRDLKNIPAYFTDPSTFGLGRTREWRPILQITYALNYAIDGYNPVVFRFFNLLFHIGTAYLIFLTVTAICQHSKNELGANRRAPTNLPGLLAGILFVVHTVNSEAVNYIWARSSLLATFFLILAFYCFLRGPFGLGQDKKWIWQCSGVVSYALGIGTKATAITLPGMLVFYEFLFLNPAAKNPFALFFTEPRRLRKYLSMGLILIGYLAVRLWLLPRMFTSLVTGVPRMPSEPRISSYSYLLTQFRAWVYYIKLFLWPHPLIMDYSSFGWSQSLWDGRVFLSLGAVLLVIVLAWRARRPHPLMTFFAVWYFIALLPEASFIPLADAVVGYRAYPAYIGLAVNVVLLWLEGSLWIGRRIPKLNASSQSGYWVINGLSAGIVLFALTGATLARNLDWRDEFTLWSDVMAKDPENPRPYMSLGMEALTERDYVKARTLFDRAIQLSPENSHAYLLRGSLNSRLDKNVEALADFLMANKLDPRSPYVFFYRGELYRKLGKSDEALADYFAALRFIPYYTDAYLGLAMTYLDKEDMAGATDACAKIIKIDPGDRRGYDCLGTLLLEQNRLSEAVQIYRQAVQRLSEDGELWYGLGVAYDKSGMQTEAAGAFEKASRIASHHPVPRNSIE